MRPINLEDDEYGSEYEEKNGSQIKKCTKYPEERLKKFNPIPNDLFFMHLIDGPL